MTQQSPESKPQPSWLTDPPIAGREPGVTVPNSEVSYDAFMAEVTRALCPICQGEMSDDGCNSNCVYIDQEGILWEYYGGAWRYGHQTVACNNHHHFKVEDAKVSDPISELDGLSRGWVLHDFGLLPKKQA